MQRNGVGSATQNVGHKDLGTGEPLVLRGPNQSDDADFCAAVVP